MATPNLRNCVINILESDDTNYNDWSLVEKEAVNSMNVLDFCLYDLYVRFTRDVRIITSLVNANFGISWTTQQIDDTLVPIRVLVLMKYRFEEAEVVAMEKRARDVGLPFDERESYYWRFMVDSQTNEACLTRLWREALAAWPSGYVPDHSDSSDDEDDRCPSDSSAGEEDSDCESHSEEYWDDTDLEEPVRVNPMTGRGHERGRPNFTLVPTSRPWDPEDENISPNVAADPTVRRSLFRELGKRGKNIMIEDRSEAVQQIIKDRMKQHYGFWRCTTVLTRFLAKNRNLNSLRLPNYDFKTLMEPIPVLEWYTATWFTEKQLKEDLCVIVRIKGKNKYFYRAKQGGDGLVRVWTRPQWWLKKKYKNFGKPQKTELEHTSLDNKDGAGSESSRLRGTSKICNKQCRGKIPPIAHVSKKKQIREYCEWYLMRCVPWSEYADCDYLVITENGFWLEDYS